MYIYMFLLGAVFGSFANVCIKRIPLGIPLVFKPGSMCLSCKKPIKWHDNIPVISYFILKGRCRSCGERFSPAYPAVEFITGLLFAAVYWKFNGQGVTTIITFLFFVLLMVIISGIDIEHRIIPDILSLMLAVAGVAFSPFNPVLDYGLPFLKGNPVLIRMAVSAAGLVAAGLIYLAIAFMGEKIFRQEALGGGDIKLIAGIGAYAGIINVLWVIFLASVLGAVAGIALIASGIKKRRDTIPYGPYICAAAILVMLAQPQLNEMYYLYITGLK